jgi:hypothetical protein
VVTVTEVVGGYRARSKSPAAMIRLPISVKVWRVRMCGRLYLENTLLERLLQYLEHMACAFGPLVEEQNAVMRPRHLTGHGGSGRRRSS